MLVPPLQFRYFRCSFVWFDDEPGAWGTDTGFKMKVGVVSVTVEQHAEGRLQDSQSMLDFDEMAVCSVVSARPRVEALGSSS